MKTQYKRLALGFDNSIIKNVVSKADASFQLQLHAFFFYFMQHCRCRGSVLGNYNIIKAGKDSLDTLRYSIFLGTCLLATNKHDSYSSTPRRPEAHRKAHAFPLGVNYFFPQDQHSFFLSIGLLLFTPSFVVEADGFSALNIEMRAISVPLFVPLHLRLKCTCNLPRLADLATVRLPHAGGTYTPPIRRLDRGWLSA